MTDVPKHIAIIPDGNRRWAKDKGLAATKGHEHSAQYDKLKALLVKAHNLGISYLSLWAFSTENWKRSEPEKTVLFRLLGEVIDNLKNEAVEENIRFRWLGRRDRVPDNLKAQLEELESLTSDCTGLGLQICFDYGGRDEILRAVNKAVKEGKEVTEKSFSALLDTADIPDPDIIIRTSGEQRVSGFMPWQATYAELYFSPKHFPDFGPDDLQEAVEKFSSRERRFGGG
ncbi:di-trans,poly-cis-decaprenylcistransferase [Candidatus Woesearchaeota archaeon]|nr:di-trans,poly-cis-decaprenylcistransferase [Candidatus Woesearchaeota archaeon]